jgi:16S rRNA (uracil1498-N3)-methyltransferase
VTLHRFFVPPSEMVGDRFPLPPAIERQVRTVLRLRDGDQLVLLPGDGSEALCRLTDGDCVVEERRTVESEPRHRLTVVQALLKGDALEEVIRQATEVGVAAFRLVLTERCVARDISPRRMERMRAIAREAAEQSERGIVPPIDEPVPFDAALAEGATILYERHSGERLSEISPPAAVLIGPEGGFAPAEVERAAAVGASVVGLGPRILRSQSVAAAAAAVVLSRTGDFA